MPLKISADALRGYLLEEALAYLVRRAGYRLLVDESQDPNELKNFSNGLRVRGRGEFHQADVLGQLEWIPAFTFPIRLFVEAKARKSPTDISAVRNAIGVITDIRENKSPISETESNPQRYRYCYALFSTSGFSKPATRLALAHEVSLIDLDIDAFRPLLGTIANAANAIRNTEPGAIDLPRGRFLKAVRTGMRRQFDIYPEIPHPLQGEELPRRISAALEEVIQSTEEMGEVFIGMANGPYLLMLVADDPRRFLNFATQQPRHNVSISWSRHVDNGLTWTIRPQHEPNAYQLTFRLPRPIAEWIAGQRGSPRRNALKAKEMFLSDISIYRVDADRDQIFRLQFRTDEIMGR